MKWAIIVMGVFAFIELSFGATVNVPSEQPTIQAGIDASANGDTVLAASGDYYENIDFLGKAITLTSVDGAELTALYPNSLDIPIINFATAEDTNCEVSGFTITGSVDTPAVRCQDASPKFLENTFINNSAGSGSCVRLDGISSPIILSNLFTENEGSCIYGSLSVNGLISDNIFTLNNADYGSAIRIQGGSNCTLQFNLIAFNTANGHSPLYISNSNLVLVLNNTVANNNGGLCAFGVHSSTSITVLNNIVAFESQGVGIRNFGSSLSLLYNDVFGNSAGDYYDADPGDGCFSDDPLFLSAENQLYYLLHYSPCKNAGHPDPQYNDPDGTRNDIGAYSSGSYGPFAVQINFGLEDRYHLVSHQPEIYWSFYDTLVSEQAGFEVEVGTDSNWAVPGLWSTGQVMTSDSSCLYDGDTLVDGESYFLRIRLSNGIEWGMWAVTKFRMNTTPVPCLIQPEDNGIITNLPPEVQFSAGDAESDVIAFTIQIATDSSFMFPLVLHDNGTSGDVISIEIDSVLEENDRYWWRVRAYDYFEESDFTAAQSFYVNTTNESPTSISLILPGSEQCEFITSIKPEFIWTKSADPDPFDTITYVLYIAIDSNFTFTVSTAGIEDTNYTIDYDLTWDTNFWWKVAVEDLAGGVTWSNEVFRFFTASWTCGDCDSSGAVDIDDVVYLINYIFAAGPAPDPIESSDANCSLGVDIDDVVYLISYIFSGGFAPCDPDGDGVPDC